MANSQDSGSSRHPDLLAAVVLHTLVTNGSGGMTVADVARACERDSEDPADVREVKDALEILLEDGLAERTTGNGGYEGREGPGETEAELVRPTRAAVRASELSF